MSRRPLPNPPNTETDNLLSPYSDSQSGSNGEGLVGQEDINVSESVLNRVWQNGLALLNVISAVGIAATAVTIMILGHNDDDTGGLRYQVDAVTETKHKKTLYIHWFLGAAGGFWFLVYMFEALHASSRFKQWLYGNDKIDSQKKVLESMAWRTKTALRDASLLLSVWAVQWALDMSAGESDGKSLVDNSLLLVGSMFLLLIARYFSYTIPYRFDRTTAEKLIYCIRARMVVGAMYISMAMAFTPIFFRHMNYNVSDKGVPGLSKTDNLLAAQWMFSSCLIAYFVVAYADATKIVYTVLYENGSTMAVLAAPFKWMVADMLTEWNPIRLFANRSIGESIFHLTLNSIMFIAIPWILWAEVINEVPTVHV